MPDLDGKRHISRTGIARLMPGARGGHGLAALIVLGKAML
jgi:hypothetical protein